MDKWTINKKTIFVISFSLFAAFVLSFLFEGQILYGLLKLYDIDARKLIPLSITAHFLGLFSSGFFIKTMKAAMRAIMIGMFLCLAITIPFLLQFAGAWFAVLPLEGYISGVVFAAWGYLFKEYVFQDYPIRSCADILILSNVLMIIINILAINISAITGLVLALFFLSLSIILTWRLMGKLDGKIVDEFQADDSINIIKPLALLFLFISIITINSGLMYQVVNPAFGHLQRLVSWYWALPYVVSIWLIGRYPEDKSRSIFLYIGLEMIAAAFIGFMLLGRTTFDYIIIDSLMLGAFGIFDLFWWSIIAELLRFVSNPAKVFGIGLSANVLGVLLGDVLGIKILLIDLNTSEIAVIALTVISATLIILPLLNRELLKILKNNKYLMSYESISKDHQ